MKKIILFSFLVGSVLFSLQSYSQALSDEYKNSVGLGIDFGSGVTGVGVSGKHFFSTNDVLEVDLQFFDNAFAVGGFYEYHLPIPNANGLKAYIGMGPQFFFGNSTVDIAARLPIGLDYKLPQIPLTVAFDWRPYFRFNNGSEFEAARFGLGIRFAF